MNGILLLFALRSNTFGTSSSLRGEEKKNVGVFNPRRTTMRAFMWQDDILSVARFVVECLVVLEASASASHQP